MKKLNNDFQENAYHTILDNGLNVYIIEKKGFKKSVAAYGTSFGAVNLLQTLNGEQVEHKQGLAHFLEHKLFEDEAGDILSQFTDLGASANAFTSYDQTVYYFSTNHELEAPLKLLIKLINRIYVDHDSIEKEKGIIVEELKMYEHNPNMNLLMKTYENVYHQFPMKYDIGGTADSVNNTTLEDVLLAYNMNYQPSQMALVVVSGESKSTILDIIKNCPMRNIEGSWDVKDVFDEEPLDVVKEEDSYQFPIQTPKASLSFKFKYDGNNLLYDEFLIRSLLNLNFSQLNDDFQSWLDQDIINSYFSFDVDLRDGFGVVYFFNEGENNHLFKEIISDRMNQLSIDENTFNQITKRYFGESILSLSQYDRYAINVMSAHFRKTNYYDYLKSIKDVSLNDIERVMAYLKDFSISFLEMRP